MALDDLPDWLPAWLPAWCADHLGSAPDVVLFSRVSISSVLGLRLADGREAVVKAREDDGRASSCLTAQAVLAERGFPCPRPLTPMTRVGTLAVHAEESLPGGSILPGDTPSVARRYAVVFARLMASLASVSVPPPLPSPRWARWDHPGPGLWPAIDFLDERDQSVVPSFVLDTASRVRKRLSAADLPCVLGHADFEAQNLRWRDGEVWAVHDWDSLAWQPEAALVGAASGAFANVPPPSLVPVESSAAFLSAYQEQRGRSFTVEELEIAWAASLWTAVHNARWEALHGDAPLSGDAVREQAAERLRLANA
jgi:Ser/Thr protein kinase RdoA (MazF antagonist)